MKTRIYVFEENNITFTLDKDNKVMINATEMAKVFNAQVNEFMSNDNTKKFIETCLKNGNSRFLNVEKEDDLYVSRQKSGTFMHRVLALKFAAWLNPRFELWVYSTIDQLLFGKHVEREKSFERTISLQKEKDTIVNNPDRTLKDFDRYLEIEKSLKSEMALRKSLTIESVSEVRDLFEN